jgi:hypothetical protein
VCQTRCYLQQVIHALGGRQEATLLLHADAQVLALDELEGDEVQPLILAAEVDAGDVLVVQPGRGAGLLFEAADVLRVGGPDRRRGRG